MSVLCSDKTGTLTTARITIHQESVWYNGKFTKEDVALYSMLASNRDKKEDAIDRSVVNHFDAIFGPAGEKRCAEYKKVRSVCRIQPHSPPPHPHTPLRRTLILPSAAPSYSPPPHPL